MTDKPHSDITTPVLAVIEACHLLLELIDAGETFTLPSYFKRLPGFVKSTKQAAKSPAVNPQKKRAMLLAAHPFCAYCYKPLSAASATLDHLTPISRNGDNTLANLVLCCRPCNEAKGDRTQSEWAHDVMYAQQMQQAAIQNVAADDEAEPEARAAADKVLDVLFGGEICLTPKGNAIAVEGPEAVREYFATLEADT